MHVTHRPQTRLHLRRAPARFGAGAPGAPCLRLLLLVVQLDGLAQRVVGEREQQHDEQQRYEPGGQQVVAQHADCDAQQQHRRQHQRQREVENGLGGVHRAPPAHQRERLLLDMQHKGTKKFETLGLGFSEVIAEKPHVTEKNTSS